MIPRGVTAVLGPSGSGKTTLLDLLVGFRQPTTGEMFCESPRDGGRLALFWCPSDFGLWSEMTVYQHLESVVPVDGILFPDHESRVARDPAIGRMLQTFGLSDKSSALPDLLSRGEQARLAVCRAVASGADFLVMDEPLVHVEPRLLRELWSTLLAMRPADAVTVFATHEPDLVLGSAAYAVCLGDGGLVYSGPVDQLYRFPPSESLAWYLGPANWVRTEDWSRWLGRSPERDRVVRPHELSVSTTATGEGGLELQRVSSRGGYLQVDLVQPDSGQRRSWLVAGTNTPLSVGQQVWLRLLLGFVLFILLLSPGCQAPERAEAGAGTEVTEWTLPPEGIRIPGPRALHATGQRLLVLDNVGRVLAYNFEGELVAQWWMPEYEIGRPEKICELPDGRLAVADTHYHRVVLFAPDGTVAGMLGGFGREPGQFIFPVATACDREGNLYVCEYGGNDRIQKFSPEGRFLKSMGAYGTGPGEFQRPSGVAIENDRLYVVDAFNNRIQVFSTDGEFLEILGARLPSPPDLVYPYDVSLGPQGDLYVVEYGAGRVTRLDREGNLLGHYGQSGSSAGQLKTPWGLTVDARGGVYVADTGNRRIVQLKF